tara:strand:- start:1607 stop:3715 length:2109 start_codon:yes stop_codon:yes gene_type:complete
MPLQKLVLKSGVNRENTRYTSEGGWYECDKIRFRQGNPEKIGGWTSFSTSTFLGVCRSLWNWITLTAENLIGVGTNLKFYILKGNAYYDITPIRKTVTLTNPFTATNGSSVIAVSEVDHGGVDGDSVIYSGAGIVGLGGNITAAVLTGTFQITFIDDDNYTITVSATANATDASGSPGGGTVITQYEVNTGPAYQVPLVGWGAGGWGFGTWGNGQTTSTALQLWNQQNFGEDLIYGPRGGGIYYWSEDIGYSPVQVTISIAAPGLITLPADFSFPNGTTVAFTSTGALPTGLVVGQVYFVVNSTGGTFNLSTAIGGTAITTSGGQSGLQFISQRGINLANAGDADTPIFQNYIVVSDASRILLVFGTNDYSSTTLDPMLIRWSDQENPYTWSPAITNQAGSLKLSHGSEIITALQARQEIIVFTDSSLYSLQYVGPPFVWTAQLLADNVSIIGPNAAVIASGAVYWMGVDKFYKYDGRVQTLNCDLRRYVFGDFNTLQTQQVYAGTNEGFNEIWWFYCSSDSLVSDRYVVYNYLENVWYYGNMGRTAWLDSGLLSLPVAATYNHELVQHEDGVDANDLGTPTALAAYISSSEFDIGDGNNFAYVWRMLPDLTFENSVSTSTGTAPTVAMTLYPLQNSGSGTGTSVGASVVKGSTYNITEEYTGIVYTRVRGRQMIFKIASDQIGTTWQLGSPRLDLRPDGRR